MPIENFKIRILAVAALGPHLLAGVPADYAGAERCGQCHPSEFALQSTTAHARALQRAKRPQPGERAFGSGEQAITFVSRADAEHYREEGKSWFRKLHGYGVTPGAATPAGTTYRTFDPSGAILRCFSCHSTGPLTLAADDSVVPHELGVRCEACHGPGSAHARTPAQVLPGNPGRLTAGQLNDFCGACHRMPLGASETIDFRDAWNVRHQPPTLAASACFLKSEGKLTCLSCHSPHAPLERRLIAYDAVCKGCHPAAKHIRAIAGRPCAGCHMPQVQPRPGLIFSNHRIAVYSPSDPLLPVRAER